MPKARGPRKDAASGRSRRRGDDPAPFSPEELRAGFSGFNAILDELSGTPSRFGEADAGAPDPSPSRSTRDHAFAPLRAEHSSAVSAWRIDLSMLLENGFVPPVAFRDSAGLARWCEHVGLPPPERIGKSSTDNIVLVRGDVETGGPDGRVGYHQIWVRKSFKSWRGPYAKAMLRGAGSTRSEIVGLDADHVLARSRVAPFDDCWLLLFPVDDRANQPFGPIEARLPSEDFASGRVDLDPLMGLKVYLTRLPARDEVDWAMRDVAGQLCDRHPASRAFLDAMRVEAQRRFG